MIGTEVLFDVEGSKGWDRKVGIIRDKIKKPYESRAHGYDSNMILDYYVIESNEKYYFKMCDQIFFKK